MRRPALILAFAALAAVALAVGAGWLTESVCRARGQQADPLDWLRTEFHLGPEQLAHVRQLYDGYLPKCHSFCNQIDELKTRLAAVLRDQGGDSPEVAGLLKQIGIVRAECQTAMLKHFVEVSRAMEPGQGRRYLAEMQRLTLFSHEGFEAQMSSGKAEDHVHPQ